MERRRLLRKIYIMLFGFSPEEWERSHDAEKLRRQIKDRGLEVESISTPSVVEAIKHMREHKLLDLVYFSGNKFPSRGEHALSDAMAIAQVLSEHSRRPWVALHPSLDYLSPVFRIRGVKVREGQISDVLWERWMMHVKG